MAPKRNLQIVLAGCVLFLMLYGDQSYGLDGNSSSHVPELTADKAQLYGSNQHGLSHKSVIEMGKQLPSLSIRNLDFQKRSISVNDDDLKDQEGKSVKLYKASYKNHSLEIQSTFDDKTFNSLVESFGHEAQEQQFDLNNPKATTIRNSRDLNETLSFVSQWELGDKLTNMIEFRPFRKLKLEAGWKSTGDLMGEASYKFAKDWRFIAEWANEPRSSDRSEEFGSKIKYGGFGELFQPSIGMKIKNKNYEKTYKDYTRRTFYFKMESILNSVWKLETSYEFYNNDYVTLDPTEKYFGREDKFNQLWFSAKYKTLRVEWGLDYIFNHLGSTNTEQSEASHNILLTADIVF